MARLSTGLLKKMSMQAYSDPQYRTAKGSAVSVLLNPSKYTHSYSIDYSETSAMGANGASPQFCKMSTEKVAFELVYDGTGVVSVLETDVSKHLDDLRSTVYNYDGKEHEPNYVQLQWGKLIFNARLSKMEISYSLFKPSGTPLRAKVQLEFLGYTDPSTLA
ncbi:MAG: peptidoglycan-binding protein, partial [Bacteroidota bacterium]